MNEHTFGRLVRRWLPLLVLGPIIGGLAGYLVIQQVPSVYQATVTLMVQPGDALLNGVQDVQGAQDLPATYAEAIHTRRILAEAANQVGLGNLPESDLEARVQARRVTTTQLLRISVEDTDPARAAQFANAVAQVFVKNNADTQASRYASSRDNLSKLINQLQTDIDARVAVINNLNAQPASPERDAQVLQLENNLTQVRTTYGNTVRSYEDLRVAEARGANTATIFDPAVEPTAPVRPNRTLTVLLAGLAVLAAVGGIALLAEYFDDRLDNGARVQRSTGLATLGALPNEHSSESLRDANGQVSHGSYRVLRSRLTAAMQQARVHTVLVTSATSGEGKSIVAANLALVLAEAGHSVILLDADLRSPAQMRLFELPNQYGLSTVLADPDSGVPAPSATWFPNLKVVTAGPVPSDASALLSSHRLRAVLDQIGSQADVLIVDGHAVLSEPDSLMLSASLDSVLFVIDARHTRGRTAARAVENLRSSGAHILGAIMNRVGKESVEFTAYDNLNSGVGEPAVNGTAPVRRTEVNLGQSSQRFYKDLSGE